jgi:hypothetical protein
LITQSRTAATCWLQDLHESSFRGYKEIQIDLQIQLMKAESGYQYRMIKTKAQQNTGRDILGCQLSTEEADHVKRTTNTTIKHK